MHPPPSKPRMSSGLFNWSHINGAGALITRATTANGNPADNIIEYLRLGWMRQRDESVPRFQAPTKSRKELAIAREVTAWVYDYCRVGWEARQMIFLEDGTIGLGAAGREVLWDVFCNGTTAYLLIGSIKELTCVLKRPERGIWKGKWLVDQQMPILLTPQKRIRRNLNRGSTTIEHLRLRWLGQRDESAPRFQVLTKSRKELAVAREITVWIYDYCRVGWDTRQMVFLADGTIGFGVAGREVLWDVFCDDTAAYLLIGSTKELTCALRRSRRGIWKGNWVVDQQMPILLTPRRKIRQSLDITPLKRSRSDSRRIVFRAAINSYTGYGLHATQIITDFKRWGYDVRIHPTHILEDFTRVPTWIKRRFAFGFQRDEWELMLNPPDLAPSWGKRTVFFTMWEASRLPPEWVKWINKAECIVVPCLWNAACFNASGVDRPIRVVPLGIKTDVFRFEPMNMTGPCVFGCAGKMATGGGKRKGLHEMIELFRQAFPSETDVRLKVKGFPDCGLPKVNDPRIEITSRFLPETQLATWYASLTCFVSVSRSEGWGLMPHQAMACGRPCIATKFGGQAEFFNEEVGYCADFELVSAEYNYTGGGVWAEPDPNHIIELMRRVYSNRREARSLGIKATTAVSSLTWERSNQQLLNILQEIGMIP